MTVYTVSLASGSMLSSINGTAAFTQNQALASTLTVNADGFLLTDALLDTHGVDLSGAAWTVNINGAIGTFSEDTGTLAPEIVSELILRGTSPPTPRLSTSARTARSSVPECLTTEFSHYAA